MPHGSKAPALIVRHDPNRLDEAITETRRILRQIGEPDAIVRQSRVAGTLKVIPEGDPHEAQAAITRLLQEDAGQFRLTSHWTAVDRWVSTDLDEIRRAVAAYQHDIGAADSWKVAVRRSQTALDRQMVIDAVVPLMQNASLDLENPTKEIRIDILGDETGVAIFDRDALHPTRR